ncbi:MAG: hypothetical protein AAFR35_02310 [Pseudomonadota bacterium]
MTVLEQLDPKMMVSGPPPGAVNVRVGDRVEGPGGSWVPCATEIATGVFCSSLFEVGAGRRQVCAANAPFRCPEEALSRAIELASTAAA